jgi:hypothetical protein
LLDADVHLVLGGFVRAIRNCGSTILLCSLLFPRAGHAQVTWQGLSFGSSIQAARAQLATKSDVSSVTCGADAKAAGFDACLGTWTWRTTRFQVSVYFRSGRLDSVVLEFKDDPASYADRAVRAKQLDKNLFEELSAKYGKPVTQKGTALFANKDFDSVKVDRPCGEDSDIVLFIRTVAGCDAIWSAGGQKITYSWQWSGDVLFHGDAIKDLDTRQNRLSVLITYGSIASSAF